MKKPPPIDVKTVLEGLQNRREFLKLFGKGLGYSALASSLSACGGGGGGGGGSSANPVQPSATPIIPQASDDYTVLKRVTFGLHRDTRNAIQSLGIDAWLEQQLDHAQIDDGNLEATIQSLFPLTQQSPVQLIAGFPDNIAEVARQMIAATQYRQIFSKRQLYEVMVEFWSDHFNIHLLNGLGPTLKPEDDRLVILVVRIAHRREA